MPKLVKMIASHTKGPKLFYVRDSVKEGKDLIQAYIEDLEEIVTTADHAVYKETALSDLQNYHAIKKNMILGR